MRSSINIQVINKNPAKQRLRAIFATRYGQVKKKDNDTADRQKHRHFGLTILKFAKKKWSPATTIKNGAELKSHKSRKS